MLDRLPTNIVCQVAQYLRTPTYKQPALQQLSQVNHRLHQLLVSQVYEYFTITDIIITGDTERFSDIQGYLSRLLITDDEEIDDQRWIAGLEALGGLDWGHVGMVSVEFGGMGDGRIERVVDWVAENLAGVRELWVELDRRDAVRRLFEEKRAFFESLEEIRIIGKACRADVGGRAVRVPEMPGLQVVYLDDMATAVTGIVDVVRRQCATLRDMNVDEYDGELAGRLGMAGGACGAAVYSRLERLALACKPYQWEVVRLDAECVPRLRSLYFSQGLYPVYAGRNLVRESMAVILMQKQWEWLEMLAVDTLSKGDLLQMQGKLPRLRVLSIGTMGSDVDLADPDCAPDAPLDIADVATILDACPQLIDLRIEVPAVFEDIYNGNAPDQITPMVERPFFPLFRHLVPREHAKLRHLTINAWALTFDQALLLVDALPRLCSLEWVLRFSSRYPVSPEAARAVAAHGALAHMSLAHVTGVRFKHVFKANLLKFLAVLGGGSGVGGRLKTLDVYGALEIPGLAGAVARVAPGCVAAFYPLVPSWMADDEECDEEDDEDEEERSGCRER
ncbi:hypothetical protein LPJ56_000770 [Coemansia sp. RSA 2599]|nr:hypothetical protein LPJ75_000257 [Coemansia sp. RSA 2598]KAJ1828948.1 hypothetical protein LPJ56_000770 [Coemansia sp. RSA 2599]